MNKKIPMRTCIVTRESLPKKELIRVVKDNLGNVSIDISGKANGRGAYIKKDIEVIKKCQKNKLLERALGINIPDSLYEELENMIK